MKRKGICRLWALLLTAVLCITAFSVTAFACENPENGDFDAPAEETEAEVPTLPEDFQSVIGNIDLEGLDLSAIRDAILSLLGGAGDTPETSEPPYIDDDCVYINEKLTIGFAMPLPIRDSTISNDNSFFIAHTVDTDGFDRTLFLPPRYLSCVSKIDAIIFPMYNNDEKNEIRQVNEDEAFKKILSNIRSHNNMINLFNTCKQLIRGCSCFELQHTNSENACAMIEKEVCNETLEKEYK